MSAEPIMHQFQNAVNEVIDKFRDQGLTFGEALGALETVKLDLWLEQQEAYLRRILDLPESPEDEGV